MSLSTEKLKLLRESISALGFDRVGFAPAAIVTDYSRYQQWLDAGFAGGMDYMHRNCCLREDPRELLAEARSVILVSMNYHWPIEETDSEGRGRVSRYARGRDYHKVMRKRLQKAELILRDEFGAQATRVCVDSAPLLERSLAASAGLGWIGKNTMLIDERLGSWTFLAALLCDLDLPGDTPVSDRCGNCTACLDACPTQAFPEPGVLDASKCISYLTIEHKGEVDKDLAEQMGDHVFGCDICQEVCPWNNKAPVTMIDDFRPRDQVTAPILSDLLKLDEAGFLDRFAGTPVIRAGLEGMKRNTGIAQENTRRIK
jgi:epoxyqueuosine reductase